MSEPAYFKVSCGACDGHIAYPQASAGQTVSCPHCSKDVFLPYQSVAPDILEPTVVDADYPQNFRRPTAPPAIRPPNTTQRQAAPAKPVKAGVDFFGKIDCRETALKIILAVVVFNILFGVLLNVVNGYFSHMLLVSVVSAITYALVTVFLAIFKSRASAIMLSTIAAAGFVLFAYQCLQDSGMYLTAFFQLLYTIATIRAVEATFKLHGQFADDQPGAAVSKMPVGGEIALGVLGAILACLVMFGCVFLLENSKPQPAQSQSAQTAQVETPHPVRQPIPVPQPETQPQEIPQPQEQATPTLPNYEWNTTEIDAMKNGNIAVAVNWLNRYPAIRAAAIAPQPQYIAKAPFNYFGKVVKVAGTVGVVQDYPAGSDNSINGQETSDIVIECEDGTIAESFCMKPSGNITTGCTVILYGYPVGVTEVPNPNGGNDTHLILVGNDYDNYGIRN